MGDESLSSCLRGLTAIELFLNASYYEKHPLVAAKHAQGAFTSINNAYAMIVSDYALDSMEGNNFYTAVIAEAVHTAADFTYSSFIRLLALANVIERPIESYFPFTEGEKDSSLQLMFNSTIIPRNPSFQKNENIHIFRCSVVPDDYLTNHNKAMPVNHFVPLLLFSEQQLQLYKKGAVSKKGQKQEESVLKLKPQFDKCFSECKGLATIKRKQVTLDLYTSKTAKTVYSPDSIPMTTADMTPVATSSMPTRLVADKVVREAEEIESLSGLDIHEWDIGNHYQNTSVLSDAQKFELLCNPWKPEHNYQFPLNSSRRKFRYAWLDSYPWLVYSRVLDGAFCVNCVLFGGESCHNSSKLESLFRTPFHSWNKATTKFSDHSTKSQVHKTATLRASNFRACLENKAVPVNVLLNDQICKQVRLNREKLIPIVEGIILCGRQNLALRGHRDSAENYADEKNNPGNLQAILAFLNKFGQNDIFSKHYQFAPKNATYRSKTTQNELIGICGEFIVQSIVDEVKEAKYFSVLADEAADISNVEQMANVIRFIDRKSQIREEFLGYSPCDQGLSGKNISKQIVQSVLDLELDMNNCRGQGYDGAGNMAGKCSGAAVRIQSQFPKALYVHCRSHVLNLCVASACKIQVVKNMMGHVRIVSQFFNAHPKRDLILRAKIALLPQKARHQHLLDVCRTRWIARIDGLEIFIELFTAIVAALDDIKDNSDKTWNAESIRDASGLYHGTISFQFIVTLIVVSRCLEVTRPLTKQLQGCDIDVVKSIEKITLLFAMLKRSREEVSKDHDSWYQEAMELAEKVGTVPQKPRTASVQEYRNNVPAESISIYYSRSLSIPFLDHLTNEISTRFSDTNIIVLNGFCGLPSRVVSQKNWQVKFESFLLHYSDDLPEPRYLGTELKMWEEKWNADESVIPSDLKSLLPLIDPLAFPNLHIAFKILATLPVTSCSCERSISVLRRVKTYLRSTTSEGRLNALALIHAHREVVIDTQQVIDTFARRQPRRMQLIDILNTDPVK